MANIANKIKDIRTAVYGADVRESIASALETAYKDADTSVEMEVICARGGQDTLGQRLELIRNSINSVGAKADNLIKNVIFQPSGATDEAELDIGDILIVYDETGGES